MLANSSGGTPHADGAARIEIVDTEAGWLALEPYWDELLYQTPDWTAFQSFRVQRLWWQHFRGDSRLFIVVLRDAEGIRALAPFRIGTREYIRRPRRLLKFLGGLTLIDRPTILRNGEDPEAVRLILDHLLEARSEWDSVLLYDQVKGTTMMSMATEVLRFPRVLVTVDEGPAGPWVDTTGTWTDFLASKSKSFKKTLKRRRNQLERAGVVRYVTYSEWPDVSEAFEIYLQIEQRSWKVTQGVHIARGPDVLGYHRDLVEGLGRLGKITFRILWLDDRPVAATFGLMDREKFLSLHIVHDESQKSFSPGVVLTAYELEQCYAHPDCYEYDFLGGFLDNKLNWGSRLRATQDIYVYRKSPLLLVYYMWRYRLRPLLSQLALRTGLRDRLKKLKARLPERADPRDVE